MTDSNARAGRARAHALRQARLGRVRNIRRRIIAGSVALFVAAWLLITVVLVSGRDPALAKKAATAAVSSSSGSATSTSSGSSNGSSGSGTGTGSTSSNQASGSGSSGGTGSGSNSASSGGSVSSVTSQQS